MDNTEVVQSIYAAFGRGDVATILGHLNDPVGWEEWTAGNSAQKLAVPWMALRQHPSEVAQFFGVVATLKFHDFQVLSILAGGNQVAAEVFIHFETPGGAHLRDEEIHLWTFNDQGKVTRFRHYADTHKHIAAATTMT